jgi:hypothetical protein
MRALTNTLLAAASLLLAFDAGAAGLAQRTQLYVGTQANCNAGVVATDQRQVRCADRAVGHTIDAASAWPRKAFVEVFAGTTAGVNAGIVTADRHDGGGSTRSIGYLARKHMPGAERLFVGIGACNQGVVTDDRRYRGCETKDIGYTLPQKY